MVINTKWDCINYGGEWVNPDYNYDNTLKSFITLFGIMSSEGWNDPVEWYYTDSTDVDYVPIKMKKPYFMVLAIFFILVFNLMFMNLFVGVVVEQFNNQKNEL